MGYTTDFSGKFKITPKLSAEHVAYLKQFSNTRRMARDADTAATLPDPIREAVGLPVGDQGEYFVGGGDFMGQGHDESITNYNGSPANQPGLWCNWEPSEDGKHMQWDGSEKFYYYVQWLEYIKDNFLTPWGYKMTGEVKWRGEDTSDRGVIVATPSSITTLEGDEYTQYKARKKMERDAAKQNKSITTEVDHLIQGAPSKPTLKI